ncbi:MAG: choice-of-anchor J domain-containing protein [Flavobacteriales bacterium]|nr:choice-of-anchor J domain-containing protein [Flavobacteriales bacterium]MCB9196256.1 choice-of-anchor J domain-containing protein [Flavobacteriales bacterium]
MKRPILLAILSLSIAISFGQTTILSEDFNDGFPAGWQMVDNDGLTPNESSAVNYMNGAFIMAENADSSGIGDSVLVATSWFDVAGEADNWLILPNLSMGTAGNYISFDARSMDASHPDGLEIRVSTGGVSLWEFFSLDTVVYSNVAMSPTWTNYTLSLDSLDIAGQNVFIAFRHISTDNYILALDNIKVVIDDPVSVEENNNSLIFYPNPSVNGIFYSNALMDGFEIYDLAGKLVKIGQPKSNFADLSSLDKGVYLIKVGDYIPTKVIIE